MSTAEFQNDDGLKVRHQRQQSSDAPQADRPVDRALLSTLGNAAVQRLMRFAAIQREGGGVDDAVARAIQAKRGTGQGLDYATRQSLEPSFGHDFSNVRVHTDSESDTLNKAVSAEAFTTGSDIFFRQGGYNPGSPEGKKLLTHELTHVVQQSGSGPAPDMTVSSPDDASEREASHVADAMASPGAQAATVGRQAALAREGAPEEEEQMAQSPIAREDAPPMEEEEKMAQSPLAREALPEEEEKPA